MHKLGGVFLDIMLERILSLIPKKQNGDFMHGEKKKFAVGIGFKSGEIVSDWIAGRSDSYKNYLYEISQKHDVSVEWLRGETDAKKPADQKADGLRGTRYYELTPENRATIDAAIAAMIDSLLKSQSGS